MKKIFVLLFAAIFLYSIYHDLTAGTLTTGSEPPAAANKEHAEMSDGRIASVSKTVRSGDTVLSVAESLQEGPLPVPVSQLVQDFKSLNAATRPENIRSGEIYKFPVYTIANQ